MRRIKRFHKILTMVLAIGMLCSLMQCRKVLNLSKFTLLVSNQSFDLDPADIKVFIDGKEKVDDHFYVDDPNDPSKSPQHNWTEYTFNLSQKTHEIKMVSEGAGVTQVEDFTLTETKHWGLVLLFYMDTMQSGYFTYGVSDVPLNIE